MKKLIFILNLYVASQFGQLLSQCVNNVNTNPPFANNDLLPVDTVIIDSLGVPIIDSVQDVRFLNGLSWWLPQNYPLTNMGFSSAVPYPDAMEWIQHVGQDSYYNYLKYDLVQKMMSPNNGWELLHVNLGRYPNNIDTMENNGAYMSFPYILLYNRYTGVARIFVRYGQQGPIGTHASGVQVDLFYEPHQDLEPFKVSGIFRLSSGLDRTLDKRSSVLRQTAVAHTNGAIVYWMSADFQLTYDPCVCFHPSFINVQFSFFKTTDLKLHGRAITTEESIMNTNSVVNHDFLGSFDQTTAVKDGFIIYKQMLTMIEDYEVRLQKYEDELAIVQKQNKKIEKYKLVLKVAKAVVQYGTAALTGSTELLSLITFIPGVKPWYEGDNDSLKVKNAKKGFFKEFDKVLWEVGDLLLKEQLTPKSAPPKPSSPTASFSEMYFYGSISDSAKLRSTIKTPGSEFSNEFLNQGSLKQSYPVYNDALGVFALLKSPEIDHSSNKVSSINTFNLASVTNNPNDENINMTTWLSTYQFKLAEDLSYYLNPALDLDSYEMFASLKIEAIREPNNSSTVPLLFLSPWGTVNLNSSTIPENEFYPIYNMNTFQNQGGYPPHYYPVLNAVPGDTPEGINTTNLEFSSPFIPRDAFKSVTMQLGFINQVALYSGQSLNQSLADITHDFNFKVYLKIALKATYETLNDDGEPNQYDYLFTYEVDPEDLTYIGSILTGGVFQGSVHDVGHSENLFFENTHFDGSMVPGCYIENHPYATEYTCPAMNEILIQGNITVDSGYSVVFKAGNIINVDPESIVDTTVQLVIHNFYDFSDPMPPMDSTMISSFCTDTNEYKGLFIERSISTYLDSLAQVNSAQANPKPQPEPEPLEFSFFPNPTNGSAQALVSLPEMATVSITLIDLTGKVIGEPIQNTVMAEGRNFQNLQTEGLSPGVYFVHLVVNGEKYVERLVKR